MACHEVAMWEADGPRAPHASREQDGDRPDDGHSRSTVIGQSTWVKDAFTYDGLGRQRTHRRNTYVDSTVYDLAGNVTRTRSAANGVVTQQFDALNRLSQRLVDSISVPQQRCASYVAGPITDPRRSRVS
jgi:YD repeat-containing protein